LGEIRKGVIKNKVKINSEHNVEEQIYVKIRKSIPAKSYYYFESNMKSCIFAEGKSYTTSSC